MAKVLTIGAIGWTAESFFDALLTANVQVFCDIRRRRGVRGREYAFANSRRLQDRLAALDITYVHRLDLAPSLGVRQVQADADRLTRTAKRSRQGLSTEFIAAYTREHLSNFDAQRFIDDLGPDTTMILFCVEREPAACHRSIVAEVLGGAGAEVDHLVP